MLLLYLYNRILSPYTCRERAFTVLPVVVHVLLRQLCTEDRWRQSPNPQFHTVVQVYWPRIHFNLRKKKPLSVYSIQGASSFSSYERYILLLSTYTIRHYFLYFSPPILWHERSTDIDCNTSHLDVVWFRRY